MYNNGKQMIPISTIFKSGPKIIQKIGSKLKVMNLKFYFRRTFLISRGI